MVWLAKWIREHVEDARVVVITDRIELDDQIEKVFKGVSEDIYRTASGADLVGVLNRSDEWPICSLIHKFGASEDGDIDGFMDEVKSHLPKDFRAKGNIFVFADECHRSHTNKLHDAMKELLPDATFIGFTGTPLLKADKKRSIEVFGPYIHTYKYDEAVRDGVVLDLRYEARDIDQDITSQSKIDQWFEAKTSGLTDYAKAQLKMRWGTIQKVLSARSRLEQIVADILIDMETRDRLKSGYGNAILVSGSIYQACQFYEMFEKAGFGSKSAIVTSYHATVADIKGEESGEGKTEAIREFEIYRRMLAAHFDEPEEIAVTKVEQFEKEVKKRFVDEPGQMKLLIVVDKLLTGFDAPPATYLYLDKQMRDHGLFQAVCRVNRLDGDDKEFGFIVDYKDLFRSLETSIHDYTGGALDGYDAADVQGLLKDRIEAGWQHLEGAREAIKALCEGVEPPRDTAAYLRYFCTTDTADPEILKENEPRRVTLYHLAGSFLRAYADLASDMVAAGYTAEEAATIKAEVDHFEKVREEVKLASGDYIDMKMYEPAMRHLLDTYIHAHESEKLSSFDDLTLVDLIVARGPEALSALPAGIRENESAVAETIENNVRKVITDEMAVNPKYYEKMSELLDALIAARKSSAVAYNAYLATVVALTKQVKEPQSGSTYPAAVNTGARMAFYDNLGQDERLAVELDTTIRNVKKDEWRGNRFKERELWAKISEEFPELTDDPATLTLLEEIVRSQHEY